MFILTSFVTNQSEMGNMTLTPKFLSLYEQGDYVRYYSREDDWTEYDDLLYGPEGSANYSPQGAARINVWGLRAEQMYYVLGECLIRAGQIDEGLDQVDKVRKYRIHPEFYRPFKGTVNTKQEAMALLNTLKNKNDIATLKQALAGKAKTDPGYADLLAKLESQAYGARIERLEQLQTEIDRMMQEVYKQEKKITTSHYKDLAKIPITGRSTMCREKLVFNSAFQQ